MAAAKHQRARAVEDIDHGHPGPRQAGGEQGQADQDQRKHRQPQRTGAAMHRHGQSIGRGAGHRHHPVAAGQTCERSQHHHGNLHTGPRQGQHGATGQGHDRQPQPVGAQLAAHAPDGLGHHGQCRDLEALQQSRRQGAGMRQQAPGQGHQQQGRGQGKAQPGGQRACMAGTPIAQRHADLAAGRAGQKLAQRHQIGISAVAQPLAPLDEFGAEVAQMRHRPAKRGQAQAQKNPEYRPRTVLRRRDGTFTRRCRHGQ